MRLTKLGKIQSNFCNNCHLNVWIFTVAIGILLITFVTQLNLTDVGRYMPAIHGDWAMHAATTRSIFLGEDFSSELIKNILNEFATYPKLSYYTASGIAHLFTISPLQGLTVVVVLSIICSCFFYGLRVYLVFIKRKINLLYLSLFLSAIFFGVNVFEIGFRDSVISNSFISQLFSIAIAQIFIYFASINKKPAYLVFYMLLSAWALINTHVIGFVWCTSSLIIIGTFFENRSWKIRFFLASIGILISIIFLLTSPGVLEMIKISGTGGDLRFWNGKNASNYSFLFYVFLFLFLFVLILINIGTREKFSHGEAFRHCAGFLSLGPLILASAITVFYRGGNWYPVVKWIYLFFPELLLSMLFLLSSCCYNEEITKTRKIVGSVFFVILFLLQTPYFFPKIDLQPAILAENGTWENVSVRRYPGLNVDHPALNYFIARSVLKIPGDSSTRAWMSNDTMSDNFLGPEDFISVAPVIPPNKQIYFMVGNTVAQRMITNRWWNLEQDHVWAAYSPATLFFIASSTPTTIQLTFVPHMPNGPQPRKYSIMVNKVTTPEITANVMDWAHPGTYSIKIAPGLIKKDGRVEIVIRWDSIGKEDLGIAMTSLKYE